MPMARRGLFGIPGLSFSWKRAIELTGLRLKASHKLGVPTTRQGMERRVGAWLLGLLFGSNKKIKRR